MKAFKIVAFTLVGILLCLVLLLGVALLPAFQTWATRKAVAGQPGMTFEVGRVAAGFSSAEITGLKVVKDGLVINVEKISVNYSAADYLFHHQVNVDALTVQGLVADLRHPTAPAPKLPSAIAAPAAPFAGLLSLARVPVDLRLAKLAVTGHALMPANRSVTFDLKGDGIAVGQRGKIDWKIEVVDATKAAPIASLQTTGSAGIQIAADRRVDLLEIETTARAQGAGLPADSLKLNLKAEQPAAAANEVYTLQIGLLRQDKVEPLLSSRVEYQASAHVLAGTWNVTVGSGQLAAILSGLGLPEAAVTGSGKFTLEPNSQAVAATGEIKADVSRLEQVSAALAAVGAMHFQLSFDARLANNVARLQQFELAATTADGKKVAQISALQSVAFDLTKQQATLSDPKAQLARISIQALPLAWAQPVAKPMTIDSGDLSLVLSVAADADGSHIALSTVEPITLRAVTVRSGTQKLVEQASFSVSPHLDYSLGKISAELAGLKLSLPAGDSVTGTVSAQLTNFPRAPVIAFTTQLQGKLSSVLKTYLPIDLGPLGFNVDAEGGKEGSKVHLAKVSTKVTRGSGTFLLSFDLQQPMDVDLSSMGVSVPKSDASAIRIRVGEIPLAWGEAFVPKSKLAGSLTSASFDVSLRSTDDFSFRTTEPLLLHGVSATLDQQALAQALDLIVDVSAHKKGDLVSYDLRQFEARQGTVPLAKLLASGEVKLGKEMTFSAKGSLNADLAAAEKQPALAAYATLAKGNAVVGFDATAGKSVQANVTIKLNELVAKQNNQPLGALEAKLEASLTTDGKGHIKLPIVVSSANQRHSDLTLDGDISHTATNSSFNGKLTSEQLFVDDFQALAALAPASPPPTAPAPTPKTPPPGVRPAAPAAREVRDAMPVWHGITGKLDADLKKVQVGADYPISNVKGRFDITETRVGIDTLVGNFKDKPFNVMGSLVFASQQAKPYTLAGTATVSGFDVGAFLRAAAPNEKPQLETTVSVTAKLDGNATNLGEFSEVTNGQFDVKGSTGVLRALGRKGQVASGASTLLGIVGAVKGSENATALAALTEEFNEMKFDQLSVHVERGADLNFNISALEFISPTMRVTGTGRIEHQANVAITDQPLRVDIQIAGKGTTERVFNEANLLSGQSDEKQYSLVKTKFVVTGTPANPDSSQIWKFFLGEAGKAAVGGLLRGLSRD
jgi:hypothetical protein